MLIECAKGKRELQKYVILLHRGLLYRIYQRCASGWIRLHLEQYLDPAVSLRQIYVNRRHMSGQAA